MLHTFGPDDRYVGRYGVEGQFSWIAFTIHIFPRNTNWGYKKEQGLHIINIGPLLEVVWDLSPEDWFDEGEWNEDRN